MFYRWWAEGWTWCHIMCLDSLFETRMHIILDIAYDQTHVRYDTGFRRRDKYTKPSVSRFGLRQGDCLRLFLFLDVHTIQPWYDKMEFLSRCHYRVHRRATSFRKEKSQETSSFEQWLRSCWLVDPRYCRTDPNTTVLGRPRELFLARGCQLMKSPHYFC